MTEEQKAEQQKIKREALTRAVHLYAEMNCHPRAWMLIDENVEVWGKDEAAKLKKEIQDQWLAVIEDCKRGIAGLKLYGVDVYATPDAPLQVKIPWAFSDEAVQEVRENLRNLLNELPENADDTAPDSAGTK